MPSSSDYTSVSGGLKLKGAKNAGVEKKKSSGKKKRTTSSGTASATTTTTATSTPTVSNRDQRDSAAATGEGEDGLEDEGKGMVERMSRAQQVLGEEDAEDGGLARRHGEEGEGRPTGHKTEAERRYEEMRRKRVRGQYSYSILFLSYPNPVPLYTIPSNVLHPILSIPTI